MSIPPRRKFDLEERTIAFADRVRTFIQKIPRTISTIEDGKQLVRSSGSVANNYIEANEALSKDDFLYRLKVCRKEAKESSCWLRLLNRNLAKDLEIERRALVQEANELKLIFNAIIQKCSRKSAV